MKTELPSTADHPEVSWRDAAQVSSPVMISYFFLAFGFGLVFMNELNFEWYFSGLMGAWMFTAAGQFLAVFMVSSGSGFWETLIAIGILNIRHIFYGLSLLKEIQFIPLPYYFKFALTDETYSISEMLKNKGRSPRGFGKVAFLNHFSWTAGCAVGALTHTFLSVEIKGIEFLLTALFLVGVIEQFEEERFLFIVIGAFSYVMTSGFEHSLSLGITLGLLICVFTRMKERKRVEYN